MNEIVASIIHVAISSRLWVLLGACLFTARQEKRKWFWIRIIVLTVAFYVAQRWITSVRAENFLPRVLHEIFSFSCVIAILLSCFRISFWESLFSASVSLAVQNLCSHGRAALGLSGNNTWERDLIIIGIYAIVYFLIYILLMRRYIEEKFKASERKQLVAFSCIGILSSYLLTIWEQTSGEENLSASLFALLLNLSLILLQFSVFEKSKLRQEKDIIEELFLQTKKQSEYSKENIEIINRKCHDLKRQIAAMRTMSNEQEREASISEIEKSVLIYEAVVQTGNEALDVVLAEKKLYCDAHDIRLTCVLNGEDFSFMNSVDIYTLFGNMLDNAIEYVLTMKDREKRVITLNAMKKGDILFCNMENYCETPLAFENGLPVTTHEDKNVHGFGMKSIRYVAEKYKGNMVCKQQNNRFSVNLFFQEDEGG